MPGGAGTLLTVKCSAPESHRVSNDRGLPRDKYPRMELTRKVMNLAMNYNYRYRRQ